MPLDFPASPAVNDTYTLDFRTWKWNGSGWELSGPADGDKGDITISGTGSTYTIDSGVVTSAKIADLTIVDGDISNTAEIAVSKLADGSARQLLQTDTAGTGVEWTSNVDIPGTLDVTGNTTFDGNVGVGISPATALLHLAAGTSTANTAPLKLTSGTNLGSAEAGAVEYDGAAAYLTPDTTIGRGFIPTTQTFRLTSAGSAIGNTITNFFGSNSNIPIVASAFYEIDIYMLALRGTTAGTAVITLTNSAAPTQMLVDWEMSPIAGIVAPPGTATSLRGQATTTTAAYAVTTGSLTNGVNHYFRLKLFLQNGTGTSLKIQMTAGTGNNTMTPQAGSVWFCKRLPGANTGTFAA